MSIIQSRITDRNIYLTQLDIPVTSIQPTDVVCKYRKSGQTSLTVKLLDSQSWIEVGDGFYILRFSGDEMNTLGYFFYTLGGPKFDNFLYDEFTIEPAQADSLVAPPGSCIITGTFKTIGNEVPRNARVSIRPVAFPISVDGTYISADAIVTYLDANGSFSVPLIQGLTVVIEVDRTGVRHQFTVPNTGLANLADLLPPIPPTV